MRLSEYFTLAELTVTSTGLKNEPDSHQLTHLKRLAYELDKLRRCVGPLRVTSGFRASAVNRAVGGSSTSAHLTGLAADIIPIRDSRDLAWDAVQALLDDGWDLDQAIIYEHKPHLHIGFTCGAPRKELRVDTGGAYPLWADYKGPLKG